MVPGNGLDFWLVYTPLRIIKSIPEHIRLSCSSFVGLTPASVVDFSTDFAKASSGKKSSSVKKALTIKETSAGGLSIGKGKDAFSTMAAGTVGVAVKSL